jgi:predicted TIM-barrel fold metal-dependent hydrolase
MPDISSPCRREFLKTSALATLAPGLLAQGPRSPARPSGVREALQSEWLADSHEHTFPEKERLRWDMDIFTLISHYAINDLVSAGLELKWRTDSLKTEIPVRERWKAFAAYWEKARNTGYCRALEIAVRDIYGADELNEKTCEQISERIRANNKQGIQERILREKSRIRLIILDDYYNVEPAEPDSSLYVTARRFDRFIMVSSRDDVKKLEEAMRRPLATFSDFERALEDDFEKNAKLKSMVSIKVAVAYQRPLYFRETSRADAERDFEQMMKTAAPAPANRLDRLKEIPFKRLQDFMLHRVVQLAKEHGYPVLIHTGLQSGNGNYVPNANPALVVNLLMDYPEVRFVLFHAGYPYVSETAAIAKNFRNAWIDLCWLHIISPSVSVRALHEYLETVPANKIFGFGGDYRYVEMSYGHSVMARENMIRALEEKVKEKYFTERQAIAVGKRLYYDNIAEFFLSRRG